MTELRSQTRIAFIATLALWLLLVASALYTRPLLSVDETRYLSVAWEMRQADHWLVPLLNGEAYHHKPPLLFWAVRLGWLVFGASEIWARLVAPLFGLLALGLTAWLGRLLWPGADGIGVGNRAMPILLVSLWWMLFATLTFFDMLLACCSLLGWIGLTIGLHRGQLMRGAAIAGLAIGLGVLAKGPVILVFLLPPAMLAPLWARPERRPRWTAWYAGVAGMLMLGAAIGLGWALPAARAGGPVYEQALLWGQTAGRVAESFAHRRPFYWYLPLLPLLLFPWSLWPPLWRQLRPRGRRLEPALRFVLIVVVTGLLTFSLISGKQPHYLLPLFPALALAAGRALQAAPMPGRPRDLLPALTVYGLILVVIACLPLLAPVLGTMMDKADLPRWTLRDSLPIAVMMLAGAAMSLWLARRAYAEAGLAAMLVLPVTLFLAVHWGIAGQLRDTLDLSPAARVIHQGQETGHPIAYLNNYQGQFHFLGRLEAPLEEMPAEEIEDWLKAHPQGWVVMLLPPARLPAQLAPIYLQRHRNRMLVIGDAETFRRIADAGPFH